MQKKPLQGNGTQSYFMSLSGQASLSAGDSEVLFYNL